MISALLSFPLLAAVGAGPLGIHDTLVPRGATWAYLDDGSNQGAAWRALGFDDGSWASGPGELGYGDGDEATVVGFGGDPDDKFITTYFRHTFEVADASLYTNLNLRLLRDDGAVVYLNGVEVLRRNLPAGPVSATTPANNALSEAAERNYSWDALDPGLLASGSNLLAIEIHQSDAGSSDISFDAELIASDGPVVTMGPYLQSGTSGSVIVVWRTDVETDSRVAWGPSPGNLGGSLVDARLTTQHELRITGLAPDTAYTYSVGSTMRVLAGDDAGHRFTTAPTTGERVPTRVWVVGDSGTANADARAVRDAYAAFAGATPTDLWLMLGDNAYPSGTLAQYQAAVFDMYPDLLRQSVVWPTRGNHEMVVNTYFGLFSLPAAGEAGGLASGTEAYYSFDHANVHFVCLDSEGSDRSVGGAMWTWLESDLADTVQDWIIAFWHHPPYTKGSHNSDNESQLIEMRERFLPLLEAAGVDLVLTGHSHSYERSFLLDGHYGLSGTLVPSMKVDKGDGRPSGSGAYNKAAGPHAGAVYCVAGCSGKVSTSGNLDHPAMVHSVAVFGSLVLDIDGGRLDATFLRDDGVVEDSFTLLNDVYSGTYCPAPLHSEGCGVTLSTTGIPSATQATPFEVVASDVIANRAGLFFYGFSPASIPFSNGWRCVGAPLGRTQVVNSGGSGLCGGELRFDFNTRIQSGLDADLIPGRVVYGQYWFRDGAAPSGTGLSEAIQFTIGP